MSTAAILLPTQNAVFADLAKALQLSFMELGWQCMWLGDKDHVREYANEIDLGVVLTPFDYKDIGTLLPKAKKVLYQLEALPWPTKIHLKRRKYWDWDKLEAQIVPNYDIVWDFDEGNIKEHWKWYGRSLNKPVLHCPVGYSSAFELQKKVSQRNIAMFIGSVSDHPKQTHRSRTLRGLSAKLGKRMQVIVGRYGDKAKQAAKNVTVNVNVHENIPIFESMRIVALLMSNRCFVVSEPSAYPGPFEHLNQYVVTDHENMAAEISYYLSCDWERNRMADNAYNFVKEHYTMTQHLREVLKQL